MNQRLDHQGNMAGADPDYEGLMRRENETLTRENQMMRDRIAEL